MAGLSRVWGTPQRLGRPGARRKVAARSGQPLRRAGGMGAGRLPCGSRALSPPPPPPLLLEPLPLLEQPPRPQHVSERAEPAAQAPSIHPTPLLLPQANPSDFASGSCSQSRQRHAPSWFHPPHLAPTPRTPSHPQFSGSGGSGTIRAVSACPAPAGAYARAPSCSGWFLRPVPPSSLLRPAPTRVPAPLLRPPLSPALGSVLRPFCLLRSAPSCSPAPLASPLPPVPSFPAERSGASSPFCQEGRSVFSQPQDTFDSLTDGFGGDCSSDRAA